MTQPRSPGAVSGAGTGRRTITWLRVTAVTVMAAAAVGALLPEHLARPVDALAVSLVVAAPVVRVAALIPGLLRESDRTFALLAGLLLVVIATGAVVA